MSSRTFFLISTLVVAQRAAAHGYLGSVAIDGTTYTGPTPSANPDASKSTSVIRQVADISPVQGASNDDLRCGLSAAAASQEADAKPGSTVEYWWSGGGGQNWPHNTGPVVTYMAECTGTTDCTTFDPTNAQWFKIDQIGEESAGKWYQAVFMQKQSLQLTLPTNLPSGHYLFRNEIIALHNAVSEGGAEFYPSCVQLNVQSGSGSTTPSPTVKFPGAYSDTDPGIFVPEIYDDDLQYVFPGGPVSNMASSSDSSGSPPADEDASTSSGDGSSAPVSSPSSSSSSATSLPSISSASNTFSTQIPAGSGAVASGSVTVPTATASGSSGSATAAPTTSAGSSGLGSGSGSSSSDSAVCKLAKRSTTQSLRKRNTNIEKRWPGLDDMKRGVEEVRRWKLGHWARMKARGMMSW